MDPLGTSLPFYENKCTSLMAAPVQREVSGSGGGLPGEVQWRFTQFIFISLCLHAQLDKTSQPSKIDWKVKKKKIEKTAQGL